MTNTKSVDPNHASQNVSTTLLDAWLYDLVKRVDALESAHEAELKNLKQTISDQATTIDELTKQLNDLPNSTSQDLTENIKETVLATARELTTSEVVNNGFITKNKNWGAQVAAAMNSEQREKIKREKNIIIFGLQTAKTPEEDDVSIHQLVSILKVKKDDIERVARLTSARKIEVVQYLLQHGAQWEHGALASIMLRRDFDAEQPAAQFLMQHLSAP